MPTMSPTSRGYKAKAKKDPASLPKPWKELKKKKRLSWTTMFGELVDNYKKQ